MTTARTFLRFVLAGVMVNVLAAACIVNSDGGDDDDSTVTCEPNTYKDCTCSDGSESQRKCNANGKGYAACVCDGSSIGGSGNEGGGTGEGATGNTAGTPSTTYGGETGSEGGAPTSAGGTPSETNGGAGGSGEVVDPGLCAEDPNDSCADCYQQGCCAQWEACVGDGNTACLTEFTNIIACAEIIKEDKNVTTGEFEQCAADESAAGGGWSSGLSPETVDMVNCVAGEDEGGWEGSPWGNLSCKAGCFDQQ